MQKFVLQLIISEQPYWKQDMGSFTSAVIVIDLCRLTNVCAYMV